MAKHDDRYEKIKRMIEYGEIKEIKDILNFVPKTVIANDLNKRPDRIAELMKTPEDFKFREIFELASHCEVGKAVLVNLIINECENREKEK